MIAHVTVRTARINETLEFYQWLLDLPVSKELKTPMGRIVFLSENETKLELIEDEKAEKINAKGLTIGFAVDDLEEKITMLDDGKIPRGDILSPDPNVRFVFFNDLNGCNIQLFEERK